MIPKKIHYCWFGQHDMPALNQACVNTWKNHLSEYEFILWDETNCPRNAFVEYHLEQKNWAFVSDYVRLYALYSQGGIYLDTDFEVLQSFDDLLNNTAFLAWESDEFITNGIAGSVKEHPFLKDCMDYIIDRFEKDEKYHISPIVTTNVFTSRNYDVSIYDKDVFYPYNPYDSSRNIKILMLDMISEHTHAIHHWGKSWEIETTEEHEGTGLCVLLKEILKKIGFKNIV